MFECRGQTDGMTTTLDSLATAVAAISAQWPGERLEGAESGRLCALVDAICTT